MAKSTDGIYRVVPGDCLAAIVAAHYPNAIDYGFVLNANPEIRNAQHIRAGQDIRLPGVDPSAVLIGVDQSGCSGPVEITGVTPAEIVRQTRPKSPSGTPTLVSTAVKTTSASVVEQLAPVKASRSISPNAYVVNVIGARSGTSASAVIQLADQHFYIVDRVRPSRSDVGQASSFDQPAPGSESTAGKTQQVGNIFVDRSLLSKTAKKTGDKR